MKFVDAVIYTPLTEEYEGFQARLTAIDDINGQNYTGYSAKGPSGERIIILTGFDWGNDAAYKVMNEFFGSYSATTAICVGIAGALTKDTKLGDIFYSQQVFDLTQRIKIEKDKTGRTRMRFDPEPYSSSESIAKALDRSRLSATGRSPYKEWKRACELVNEGRLAGIGKQKVLGKHAAAYKIPEARNGKFASSNMVLADEHAVQDIIDCGRKMVCVDLESAGFAKACYESRTQHIVVRGISDMADETKKVTEEQNKNTFRAIAMSNAALFVVHNLSRIVNAENNGTVTSDISQSLIDPATIAISENEKNIRDELVKRSVVFKTVDQDYKMPVPRLRKSELSEDKKNKKQPELEIEQAILENPRIVIELPNHYPDTALPWLFAHLLTDANLHDKYTVPVCVTWSEFGPPKNDLDAQLETKGLLFAKNNPDYQIVFIFTDAKLGSKSKAQYLSTSFDSYRNANILLFPDRSEQYVYENEMELSFQPVNFRVQGISFSSITKYVKDNFGMDFDEAEVVAKRLISTFNNYKINVHPTYLASIQRDTVLTFIEANQRGELIELAVAGLLSLLVADDKAKVVLRRGTRERFLSKLAVDIYCQKESFTASELNDYVNSYALEMGFDINSDEFIRRFVENGIIVFEQDKAEISVPVIKSYMIAKGLLNRPEIAREYFNLDDTAFDQATFDLYSEFNDRTDLYEVVSERLQLSNDFFRNKTSAYDEPVRNGKFNSHLLSRTVDISKVSNDITKQGERLVEVTSLSSEKQARLDIQAEIAQSQAAKNIDISDPDSFEQEHVAVTRFVAGATLLGAAAEKMKDDMKLRLIGQMLELGSLICTDVLTLITQKFDTVSAADEVLEQISSNADIEFEDATGRDKLKKFVELLVAEWEFLLAARPVISILNLLCETGRTNVLSSQLNRIEPQNLFEEYFRTLWAFDMDPSMNIGLTKELSKDLGTAPFLRIISGLFLVNRIYWYHHGKAKKQNLLKGVNEIFKPISLSTNVDVDKDLEDA